MAKFANQYNIVLQKKRINRVVVSLVSLTHLKNLLIEECYINELD